MSSPNQRARRRARLASILGLNLREAPYVHFFGWTIKDLREELVARRLFDVISGVASDIPGPLLVGRGEGEKPLKGIGFNEFRQVLHKTSSLDPQSGGLDVGRRAGDLAFQLDWSTAEETPFGSLRGVAEERFFDRPEFTRTFLRLCLDLAMAASCEYLFAIHGEDEDRKRRLPQELKARIERGELGNVPLYSAKPARYIPSIPWLLVLGSHYVEFFSKAVLENLPEYETGFLPDGSFFFTTAPSPLDYGTLPVVEREARVLDRLGRDAFFDPENPYRVAKGPEYPDAYRKWVRDPVEAWIGQPGRVMDAYPAAGGFRVGERRKGGNQ